MIETLGLHAPETAFTEPYIRAALPGVAITDIEGPARPDMAVMISSCDIYGPEAPEMCTEEEPVDTSSLWAKREEDFTARCAALGIPAMILRCSDIIGTGMTGFPRELVNAIWRGTFFHFPGNEARRSVIHATAVADLVRAAASAGLPEGPLHIYNVTDGENPTVHDLAEALAYRLRNKRISTLSTRPQQMIGRWLYGRRRYASYTTSRTFSGEKAALEMAFRPSGTCEYLRTHIYDNSSL